MSIDFKKIAKLLEAGDAKAVRKLLPKIKAQVPKAAVEIEAQILASEGKFDEALDILRPYVENYTLDEIGYPNLISFIRVLMHVKAWEEAFNWCMKAIDLDDQRVEAPEQMYTILTNNDRWGDALHVARRLQENFPESLKYKKLRLIVEGRIQNHDDALRIWEEIKDKSETDEIAGDNQLHSSMVSIYMGMGRVEDAWNHVNKFDLLNREDPVLALGLPILFQLSDRYDEGLDYLQACIGRWPHVPEFKWNLSLMQLGRGDMVQGWESYDYRWEWDKFPSPKKEFSIPLLSPKNSMADQSIYLWAEQGLGDNLMFLSFLPSVFAEKPARVLCEAPSKLIPLVETLYPEVQFVEFTSELCMADDALANSYDYHLPIGSLPRRYIKKIEDFQLRKIRKFSASKDLKTKLLGPSEKSKVVGLAWRSGLVNHDRMKYYLSSLFARSLIAENPDNVTFVILQYSLKEDERKDFEGLPNVIIPDEDFYNDIFIHAKYAACCDFVVTPGTILVSLCGHAGVPALTWRPKNSWMQFGTNKSVVWQQVHAVRCDPGWDKGALGVEIKRLAKKAIQLL